MKKFIRHLFIFFANRVFFPNSNPVLVKKCLLKKFDLDTFDNYFQIIEHKKNTRNNNYSVRLPRVKLELARQGFFFVGGSLYNSLPLELRQVDDIPVFKRGLKEHFK